MGPFTHWPNAYGFDHFYGFLAGETSQYEPRLVENRNVVEPPRNENYHLSEDLADRAITWLKQHRSYAPDHPFLMYWAPGAAHGPHQIFQPWADQYAGQFDQGGDELRKEIFARQKSLGWIPTDTQLTRRAATMDAWDDIPADQRAFQTRLMEVFAGYVEHVDAASASDSTCCLSRQSADRIPKHFCPEDRRTSASRSFGIISSARYRLRGISCLLIRYQTRSLPLRNWSRLMGAGHMDDKLPIIIEFSASFKQPHSPSSGSLSRDFTSNSSCCLCPGCFADNPSVFRTSPGGWPG